MELDEFLKHVYHTRQYVIIPALGAARLDKKDFLNKKGHLDSNKLKSHLTKLWEKKIKK